MFILLIMFVLACVIVLSGTLVVSGQMSTAQMPLSCARTALYISLSAFPLLATALLLLLDNSHPAFFSNSDSKNIVLAVSILPIIAGIFSLA